MNQARLDDILEHLVLAALTVDMKQVQILSLSHHVTEYLAGLHYLQLHYCRVILSLGVLHPKCFLALQVSWGEEDCPVCVSETHLVNPHLPLLLCGEQPPRFIQQGIEIRYRLVDMHHTEQV